MTFQRPPVVPPKYFVCDFGAQTHFNVKNHYNIFNGSYGTNRLQDFLIDSKFFFCPECENLETDLHVMPKEQRIADSYNFCRYQTCFTYIINSGHLLSKTLVIMVTAIEEIKEN